MKKCIYCNEIMTYGPQRQVRTKTVTDSGKQETKYETIIEYGWRCSMKDDNCDIVFDEKEAHKS
jgi:hypothetical protein